MSAQTPPLLYDALMNQGGKFSDYQSDYEDLMDFLKKLAPTTKVYTVWCFDPHFYGGESTLIRVFKSKENAEKFTTQRNEEETDSYSYSMEEEELYD